MAKQTVLVVAHSARLNLELNRHFFEVLGARVHTLRSCLDDLRVLMQQACFSVFTSLRGGRHFGVANDVLTHRIILNSVFSGHYGLFLSFLHVDMQGIFEASVCSSCFIGILRVQGPLGRGELRVLKSISDPGGTGTHSCPSNSRTVVPK